MLKILKALGVVVGLFAIGLLVIYFAFFRGLPRPEIALQPLEFSGKETAGLHDCFWMGPVTIDAFNTAYPDGGAIYWPTVFKFPAAERDSYIEIAGQFPRSRYLSIHSYTGNAVPYDHLNDQEIVPDEGSQNPFKTGKHTDNQSFTLRVYPGAMPETPAQNALYLGPLEKVSNTPIILRSYVSEVEGDNGGGAGLPQVTLVRSGGERISGSALCDLLQSPKAGEQGRFLSAPVIPRTAYDKMIHNREVRSALLKNKQEEWTVFWDPRISVARLISPAMSKVMKGLARWGVIMKTSGFFANFDNEYVSMYINQEFGPVTVLRGKLPKTPPTGTAAASGEYDMRYWSICTNEGLATTRFTACLFDSEVTIDQDRNYTIVISKPSDRPKNATAACGVSWMDFGVAGDGAGNTGLAVLILRNMLPNPAFKAAVQNIQRVGDEKSTMGDYLPIPDYMETTDFEAPGCANG